MSLMELIVALAVLSVTAAIVAPLVPGRSVDRVNVVDAFQRLRHDAVRGRTPIRRQLPWGGATIQATAFPDGTILVDTAVPIDHYTGAIRNARR